MEIKNNQFIGTDWQDARLSLLSQEELTESDIRVTIIGEIIKARQSQGLSQKRLESVSGVKQPIIARLEKGTTDPRLSTLIKILSALGLGLQIVPLPTKASE